MRASSTNRRLAVGALLTATIISSTAYGKGESRGRRTPKTSGRGTMLGGKNPMAMEFVPFFHPHLAVVTHGIMRGKSPVEAKDRELIAAYASKKNRCHF